MKKATPAWKRDAQCVGKHRFDNGGIAKSVARKTSARHDASTQAYRCEVCGGWHIGNRNKGKK